MEQEIEIILKSHTTQNVQIYSERGSNPYVE